MTSFFCSTAFSVSKQLSLWIWIDEFHLLWKYHQLCSNIFTRWVFPFWLPLSRRSGCKLLARSHAGFRPLCSSFDHFNILVNGMFFNLRRIYLTFPKTTIFSRLSTITPVYWSSFQGSRFYVASHPREGFQLLRIFSLPLQHFHFLQLTISFADNDFHFLISPHELCLLHLRTSFASPVCLFWRAPEWCRHNPLSHNLWISLLVEGGGSGQSSCTTCSNIGKVFLEYNKL